MVFSIVIVIISLIAATSSEAVSSSWKKCSVDLNKVRNNLFEAIPAGICKEPGYGVTRATSGDSNVTHVCIYSKTIDNVLPSLSKKSKSALIKTISACSSELDFCNGLNPQHIGACTGTVATTLVKIFTKDLKKKCAKVNKGLKSISGSGGAIKLKNLIPNNAKSCSSDSTGYSVPCKLVKGKDGKPTCAKPTRIQ